MNSKYHDELSPRDLALIDLTAFIARQDFGPGWLPSVHGALRDAVPREDIEELVLHLSIYVGFPKALQTFQRLKQIGAEPFRSALSHGVRPAAPGQFNFFRQKEIQDALYAVHPDFGWIAGTNAVALCDRGGLTPRERALVTLASDVCQEVFEGPFQIHVRMVRDCGGEMSEIAALLEHLDGQAPERALLRARAIFFTLMNDLSVSQRSTECAVV